MNTLEGGAFIQSYNENGRDIITHESDRTYPDCIRYFDEWELDFEPEMGQHSSMERVHLGAWHSISVAQRCPEVRQHHENNAPNLASNYTPQSPQQPFYPPPPPSFGGNPNSAFRQSQPSQQQQQPGSTPRHSNQSAPQQNQQFSSQQQFPQQYYMPPQQQQQQQQQPPPTHPPYQSPPQYPPLSPQTYYQTQHSQPPQLTHLMQTRYNNKPFHPSKPTPGVPPAAGMPNSSKVTVETVDESMSESEDNAAFHYKKPAARGVLVKKKTSFFTQVKDTFTGNSSTDDSRSTHMRSPPHKYHIMNDNSDSTTSL